LRAAEKKLIVARQRVRPEVAGRLALYGPAASANATALASMLQRFVEHGTCPMVAADRNE
jgi:hypothetical protein